MTATHLAYPDLALEKFSGTDPNQDAESIIQSMQRKNNFALGDALANYSFRKKALFFLFTQKPQCRMAWKHSRSRQSMGRF